MGQIPMNVLGFKWSEWNFDFRPNGFAFYSDIIFI